jgi:hypothetical protein
LFKLNLMSKLAPTTPQDKVEEFEDIIALTFEQLTEFSDIENIMKYVASSRGESVLSSRVIMLMLHHFKASKSTLTSMMRQLRQ